MPIGGKVCTQVEGKRMALGSPVAAKVWVAQEQQENVY